MSARQTSSAVRPRNRFVLGIVLGTILLLLAVAEAVSFTDSRRLQASIHELVVNTERSTYLIGDIGHLLSRFQANVLEAWTEAPAGVAPARERISQIEEGFRARLAELPGLLSREERARWAELEPELEAFRAGLERAFALLEEGRNAEAEQELDLLAGGTRRTFDALQAFLRQNQDETRAMVARLDEMLLRRRVLELALAGLLAAGTTAIALAALRVIRRQERELSRHLERIESSNRDLEAFAGRVAHDLRDVLAPLQPSARVLTVCAREPDTVAATAERVERVARRASDMLSGLLAFARAGAARPDARARVDDELRAVLEELGPLVERTGARVETSVEHGLVVRCEPALLHVLLLNLLGNAVKFLAERPVRRVRVRVRSAQDACALEVEDTGPGIPGAALQHIFEPFYRAPGTVAPGTGIGLATVRRIVEAHGGTITVESAEGTGSCFRVRLPLVRAAAPTATPAPAPLARG